MGIHARPAAMIVRIANRYKADLYVEKDDEVVDGKSIMGLMMLAAGNGSVYISPQRAKMLKLSYRIWKSYFWVALTRVDPSLEIALGIRRKSSRTR